MVVAILDGAVDTRHPALKGSSIDETRIPTLQRRSPDTAAEHGTHVASIVFGQHSTEIKGVAPRCQGLAIPIFETDRLGEILPCSQAMLANAVSQAIEYARNRDASALVINVSGGQHSASGEAHPVLADVLTKCDPRKVLVVAAAGNDGCDCVHVPAALSSALAVGSIGRDGEPLLSSNWGGSYQRNGVMAPGENIPGASSSGALAARTGTSYATPIVSGIAALLLSLQLRYHGRADAHAVKKAILEGSIGCADKGKLNCRRRLYGILNVSRTVKALFLGADSMTTQAMQPAATHDHDAGDANEADNAIHTHTAEAGRGMSEATSEGKQDYRDLVPASACRQVEPSDCGCGKTPPTLVFALGKVGYDFQSEARRDTIIANMEVPPGSAQGNPYDPAQLLKYLKSNPSEAARITWTLNHDATPIYAILPEGAFAADAYEILVEFLNDQLTEGVEVISIPGHQIGTARLSTGQPVPIVVPQIRGMYSWTIEKLIDAATTRGTEDDPDGAREPLGDFLTRIYYEFRNLGQSPQDRALNFAGTQVFRIAVQLARQQQRGFQLDAVEVVRSPICRPESDCWDVKLIFFDPENVMRARSAVLLTIDVSDAVPVMISDGIREFAIR